MSWSANSFKGKSHIESETIRLDRRKNLWLFGNISISVDATSIDYELLSNQRWDQKLKKKNKSFSIFRKISCTASRFSESSSGQKREKLLSSLRSYASFLFISLFCQNAPPQKKHKKQSLQASHHVMCNMNRHIFPPGVTDASRW